MVFGSDAGERLEPMRVMGGAVLDRPVLHGFGHGVCNRRIERFAVSDRLAQRLVSGLRQPLLLFGVAERETPKAVAAVRRQCRWRLSLLAFRDRPVADRTNRVAQHCGTHRRPPFDVLSVLTGRVFLRFFRALAHVARTLSCASDSAFNPPTQRCGLPRKDTWDR